MGTMDIWRGNKVDAGYKIWSETSAKILPLGLIFPLSAEFLMGIFHPQVQRNRRLRTYRSNKKPTFRGTPHRYRRSTAVKFEAPL